MDERMDDDVDDKPPPDAWLGPACLAHPKTAGESKRGAAVVQGKLSQTTAAHRTPVGHIERER